MHEYVIKIFMKQMYKSQKDEKGNVSSDNIIETFKLVTLSLKYGI